MAAVEKYTLRELQSLIQRGKKYRLFKPFLYNGQVLLNVEKILTEKDVYKLEGKHYGPLEVIPGVEHNVDDKIKNTIIANCIKILKSSKIFHLDDVHHLDFKKRKECEKLIQGILYDNSVLADNLLKIYKHSKKLFIHTVKVAIIAVIIDLGLQEKRKIHDALRSEELLTGALLHDIGFLKLPPEMAEKKRVDYSDDEKEKYKTYPLLSKQIAEGLSGHVRSKTITIIAQHQERSLGNGFPQGIEKNNIDEMALILGLADEFELLLSGELSQTSKSPTDVMSRFSRSAKLFTPDIVDSFYTWFRYLK